MKLFKKLLIVLATLFSLWFLIGVASRDFMFIDDSHIDGHSMEPTFHDGDYIYWSSSKSISTGDIISLKCFSKCSGDHRTVSIAKRITRIDGDKIWIEGDNHADSYDSRYYGWLSPSDYKLDGVIIYHF
jgi:signal peptidase I